MTSRLLLTSVWLGLTACFAAANLYWQWSSVVAAHERETTSLHRIVSQRVDQHDAHLTGLSALTTSSEAPPLEALRAVAATIIQFYPRIVAVDIIALDSGAELPAIHTSREAPQTVPFDLILTAAQRGSRRAETVLATGSTGRYLLVKRAPNSDAARYALSLEIDGRRLVATDGMTADTEIALALPDGRSIFESLTQPNVVPGYTVPLRTEKTLASASQSMGLSLARQISILSLVPWGLITAFAAVAGMLLLLFRNLLVARRAEENAVVRAGASAQEARIAHATRINAMGELSLGIAHELTQPLAALLSQSQAGLRLLKSDVPDYTAITGVLEANARHAKRAGALLKKLRDWNSTDPPTNQTVDLNQIVTEIASLNRAELERRGIELQLKLFGAALLVRADHVGLEQIAQNLCANARDACEATRPLGGQIIVTTFTDGDHVGFAVCDNGPGLDLGAVDRLFEPFFTSKPDGMGLGLSICRRLVEAFGGEISATNRTDGPSGAVITVVLPIDRQAVAQEPQQSGRH
jgi:two-component system, LuxR family, sensor kinase FixL